MQLNKKALIEDELIKAKEKLAMKKNKRSTFKGDSEKELAMFPLLEAELYKWVVDNRKKGCVISGTLYQFFKFKNKTIISSLEAAPNRKNFNKI